MPDSINFGRARPDNSCIASDCFHPSGTHLLTRPVTMLALTLLTSVAAAKIRLDMWTVDA